MNKQKTKLARKMRTKQELKARVPIFLTKAWEKRKEAKRKKAVKQQTEAHKRAVRRKIK